MNKNEKLLGTGTTLSLAGMGSAVFGKKLLWKIFSATRGKALNGICETRCFLNWVAKLVGGSGIATGAKILRYSKIGAITITVAGTVLIIYSICNNKKKKIAEFDTSN